MYALSYSLVYILTCFVQRIIGTEEERDRPISTRTGKAGSKEQLSHDVPSEGCRVSTKHHSYESSVLFGVPQLAYGRCWREERRNTCNQNVDHATIIRSHCPTACIVDSSYCNMLANKMAGG